MTLAFSVLLSFPNSRSVALPTLATDDRSNRRYPSRVNPSTLFFTCTTVADPKFGLKTTGRLGKSTVGAYVAEDEITQLMIPGPEESNVIFIPGNNRSSAFRYRFNVGETSSIGAMLTTRDGDGYNNRVYGVDGNFRFTPKDTITAQILGTQGRYPLSIQTLYEQPASTSGIGAVLVSQVPPSSVDDLLTGSPRGLAHALTDATRALVVEEKLWRMVGGSRLPGYGKVEATVPADLYVAEVVAVTDQDQGTVARLYEAMLDRSADGDGLVELRDRHPIQRRIPLELGMSKLVRHARQRDRRHRRPGRADRAQAHRAHHRAALRQSPMSHRPRSVAPVPRPSGRRRRVRRSSSGGRKARRARTGSASTCLGKTRASCRRSSWKP